METSVRSASEAPSLASESSSVRRKPSFFRKNGLLRVTSKEKCKAVTIDDDDAVVTENDAHVATAMAHDDLADRAPEPVLLPQDLEAIIKQPVSTVSSSSTLGEEPTHEAAESPVKAVALTIRATEHATRRPVPPVPVFAPAAPASKPAAAKSAPSKSAPVAVTVTALSTATLSSTDAPEAPAIPSPTPAVAAVKPAKSAKASAPPRPTLATAQAAAASAAVPQAGPLSAPADQRSNGRLGLGIEWAFGRRPIVALTSSEPRAAAVAGAASSSLSAAISSSSKKDAHASPVLVAAGAGKTSLKSASVAALAAAIAADGETKRSHERLRNIGRKVTKLIRRLSHSIRLQREAVQQPDDQIIHDLAEDIAGVTAVVAPRYVLQAFLGQGAFGFLLSARTRDTHERVTLKFMRKAKMSPEMMTEDDQGVAVPREFEMLRRCAKYEYILDYVDHHQTDVYWILVTKLFGVPWDKATAAQTSETAMDLPQLVATPAERQEFSLQREQAAAAAASVRPAAAAADAESAKPVQHQGVAALFEHGCMTRPVSHDLFECIDAHIQQPATTGANGLPPYLARYVFAQVALAVGYLHQRNIFHRDIKDENCLVDAMYRVRLIDFGSVTELPYGENNVQFTDFVGTMTYAPPQAVLHEPFLPAKNETWALGVLLYTMVFGCNPFASTEEALRGLRHIPDPDGIVDADLRSLLKGCLRVDEKQRYGITEILTSPWLYAQARALDPNGLVMRRFPARAGSTRRRQMVKSATEATEPANGLALAAEL